MTALGPRGRWWDDPGLISEADARAEAAVTAWETAEPPLPECHEPVRAGRCFICGRPSDNDAACRGCDRDPYDSSGVRP